MATGKLYVTNSGSISVAVAVKTLINGGTSTMVAGAGLAAWDSLVPLPQPKATQSALVAQLGSATLSAVYLATDGSVSGSPTATLQLTATFGIGVANGTIREIGIVLEGGRLFGAWNFAGANAVSKPAGGNDYAWTKNIIIRF